MVIGGMTSHAAVVARGWGTPCVAGCGAIKIDEANKTFCLADNGSGTKTTKVIREGDWISLNGTTGEVIDGKLNLIPATIGGDSDLERVLSWADRSRRLGVRTNTDQPTDAQVAAAFGAEGIGLVRTERMFFKEGRIVHMVKTK
jgi:pyruvate,orthophosphate dikinase